MEIEVRFDGDNFRTAGNLMASLGVGRPVRVKFHVSRGKETSFPVQCVNAMNDPEIRGGHRWLVWPAGAALALAVFVVYAGSLEAPFQFDDQPAILYNPTIRQLQAMGRVLSPPDESGVAGRPLVNLSLAANYALGGLEVKGYHLMNLTLHLLAALLLWGVLRRTLRLPVLPRFSREHGEALAGSVALLWAVHPLQTETVVGIVQRNEIMGGLFYLLTLYGFVRSTEPGAPGRGWQMLAVTGCLLGMASKEIVATAPLTVFVYDRTFVAGGFAAAWRQRKGFYSALAGGWLLLGWLMVHNHQRGGTVGFGLGLSSWDYLLTQCWALTTYLKLSFWPHPLIVDYGTATVHHVSEIWVQGLLVLILLGATIWALVRRPVWGFIGWWFFVILAPSSSFVPLITQPVAEHRMYLPLAAVLTPIVIGLMRLGGRKSLVIVVLLATGLGWVTVRRNRSYETELALWRETVVQAPTNQRARLNLGQALFRTGNISGSAECFEAALQLKPDYAEAHYNLGLAQARLDRIGAAIENFQEALRLVPDYAVAHNDLGIALAQSGRGDEAQAHFEAALRLRPDFAGARFNLASLFLRSRRPAEAIPLLQTALRQHNDSAEYHDSMALALMQTGRRAEAVGHYVEAVRLMPQVPELRLNLALALAAAGRLQDAIPQVEEALRLRPDFVEAQHYLAEMRTDLAKSPEGQR